MKTTFDLSEPLLREVQALAKKRGTTSKSLVEQALRRLLDEQEPRPFVVTDASVGGAGLQAGVPDLRWESIRDIAYGMPPE